MQVEILHPFYNASGNRCPSLQIRPTGACSDRMTSLGLLFKDDISSFSILLNQTRQADFLSYLRSQIAQAYPGPGGWLHLSFILTIKSPYFTNITDMPIDKRLGTWAYYLSNSTAEVQPDGTVSLNPGKFTGVLLTGSQCQVNLQAPGQTQWLVVRNVAGKVVMSVPVVWWTNTDQQPTQWPTGSKSPAAPVTASGKRPEYRDPIYLDFSQLPEGKYQISECEDSLGATETPVTHPTEVVYTTSSETCFCFIDLFFSAGESAAGVYPITDLEDPAQTAVTSVQYALQFENRRTVWNYYIVSTNAVLQNLRIDTMEPQTSPPITFTGPTPVTLPNQQPATLFRSDTPIPLQEQSTYSFRLLGSAGPVESRSGVLMNRLPVASKLQVIPRRNDYSTSPTTGTLHDNQNYSEIYVYV